MTKQKDRRSDKSLPLLSRTVQLRFSDDQYEELRQLAEANEVSIGQQVRMIVGLALLDPDHPVDLEGVAPEVLERWRDAIERKS